MCGVASGLSCACEAITESAIRTINLPALFFKWDLPKVDPSPNQSYCVRQRIYSPALGYPENGYLARFWKVEAEGGPLGRDGGDLGVHHAAGAEMGTDDGFIDGVTGAFPVDEPDGNGLRELLSGVTQRGDQGLGCVDAGDDEVGFARGGAGGFVEGGEQGTVGDVAHGAHDGLACDAEFLGERTRRRFDFFGPALCGESS